MHQKDYVRRQTTTSLKEGVSDLKNEARHQRARVRGARNVFKLHKERLKDLNLILRNYRSELHRRRAKRCKK